MVKHKLTLEIDNNKQFSKKLIVVNIDTITKQSELLIGSKYVPKLF